MRASYKARSPKKRNGLSSRAENNNSSPHGSLGLSPVTAFRNGQGRRTPPEPATTRSSRREQQDKLARERSLIRQLETNIQHREEALRQQQAGARSMEDPKMEEPSDKNPLQREGSKILSRAEGKRHTSPPRLDTGEHMGKLDRDRSMVKQL